MLAYFYIEFIYATIKPDIPVIEKNNQLLRFLFFIISYPQNKNPSVEYLKTAEGDAFVTFLQIFSQSYREILDMLIICHGAGEKLLSSCCSKTKVN